MPTPQQQLASRMRAIQRPLRPAAATPGPVPGLTPHSGSAGAPPGLNAGPVGRPPTAMPQSAPLPAPAPVQSPAPAAGARPASQPASLPEQSGPGGISKVEFARDTLTDKAKAGAVEAESAAKIQRDDAAFQAEQARIEAERRKVDFAKEFGDVPDFAKLPGAPALPMNPTGGPSFNPFTGQWTKMAPVDPSGLPPAGGGPTDPPEMGGTRPPVPTPAPGGGPTGQVGPPLFAPPPPGSRPQFVTSQPFGPEVKGGTFQIPLADILRRRAAAMQIHGGKAGPQV